MIEIAYDLSYMYNNENVNRVLQNKNNIYTL